MLSTSILLPPLTGTSPSALPLNNPLSITFFSASSIPLALPPIIARGFGWPKWGFGVVGINERVGQWLLGTFTGDARESHSRSRTRSGLFGAKAASGKKVVQSRAAVTAPEPRIRGWAYMDFYEDPAGSGVVSLLVECNFRGRRFGEEGWI